MAIQKEKTLANGSVGNYWRVTSVFINRQAFQIDARIALFKDVAASSEGKPPLGENKSFIFSFTMAEFLAAPNAIHFVYTKIKEQAAVLTYFEINGEPVEPPTRFDADIYGGIDVY